MDRFHIVLIAALALCLVVTSLAVAKDKAPVSRVELLSDQEAGTFRIVIDGKPVIAVDANGLHINGDVIYAGSLVDTGPNKAVRDRP